MGSAAQWRAALQGEMLRRGTAGIHLRADRNRCPNDKNADRTTRAVALRFRAISPGTASLRGSIASRTQAREETLPGLKVHPLRLRIEHLATVRALRSRSPAAIRRNTVLLAAVPGNGSC